MPYGLNSSDRPSSYEIAANAAAEAERQRRAEERAAFSRTFKAGGLRPTATPELRAIIAAFNQTQEYTPPTLTDEQKQLCAPYIAKAKLAIDRADLMGLDLALGPDLHADWKEFLNTTRRSYWEFLGKLIQLKVQQEREKALLEFAQEQHFPEQLNREQQITLKGKLLEAFLPDKAKIPQEWQIDDSLAVMAKAALKEAYAQEHRRIEKNESRVTDLAEALHVVAKSCRALSGELSLGKQKQEKRVRDYASSMVNDAEATWTQFQEKALRHGASQDELQALRACRIAQASLEEVDDPAASLVDYALKKYESADAEQKAALLPLLHTIIAHGGKPSAGKRLDWEILEILLKYADASTPRAQVTSQALLPYVRSSKEQVASFWWRMFNSTETKESRRTDVQAIGLALCAGVQPGESMVVLDQRVADSMRAARERSRSALRGSELGSCLDDVERRSRTVMVIGATLFSGPEIEMKEKKGSGAGNQQQHAPN